MSIVKSIGRREIMLFWLCVMFSFAIFCIGIKLYNYDKRQKNTIVSLTNQLNEMAQRNEFIKQCGKGYDYLAIGNSITLHSECDFWWNECGMAATNKDNDYVHIVSKELSENCMGGGE